MAVVAKFFVQSVTPTFEEQPNAASRQITMGAVCRGAANREWASATPSGSLTMNVRNDAATGQLEVGQEYYLTIERAEPKPAPGDGHEIVDGVTPWGSGCCEVCGMVPSWVKRPDSDEYGYVWDEKARAHHAELYGA